MASIFPQTGQSCITAPLIYFPLLCIIDHVSGWVSGWNKDGRDQKLQSRGRQNISCRKTAEESFCPPIVGEVYDKLRVPSHMSSQYYL